ncbi:MAG: hypothetical protein U9Q90_10390 [Campylobacterota bacterium]|nr:hypothetical protein [Campylobacterota bacterium]
MKKVVLSAVAVSALALTGASASNSSEIKALKSQMASMSDKIDELEKKDEKYADYEKKFEKATVVKSKVPVLKFSGVHYLGFIHQTEDKNAFNYTGPDGTNYSGDASSNTYDYFSTRRNYLQVKAYFADNPKSYMRMTLDTVQIGEGVPNAGDWEVRLKYAYLYLDDILPYTGVEFGQAHRPWIDYEEHHGWRYRSIAKVFVESKADTDFTNSADLGINFKTKTEYFSSEIGLFNGEGYHGLLDKDLDSGLSFEWRLTANILGTGKQHVGKSDTYLDASFFGQYNQDYEKKGEVDPITGEVGDLVWYGLNAVYNQPNFLLNATYAKADKAGVNYKGNGWSVNGTYRFVDDWANANEYLRKVSLIGRYDYFELDAYENDPREAWIAGITYQWNKNVEFILNYTNNKDPRLVVDPEDQDILHAPQEDKLVMFTAAVHW